MNYFNELLSELWLLPTWLIISCWMVDMGDLIAACLTEATLWAAAAAAAAAAAVATAASVVDTFSSCTAQRLLVLALRPMKLTSGLETDRSSTLDIFFNSGDSQWLTGCNGSMQSRAEVTVSASWSALDSRGGTDAALTWSNEWFNYLFNFFFFF